MDESGDEMTASTGDEAALEALEDASDIAAITAAMMSSEPTVSWQRVKADLGWT